MLWTREISERNPAVLWEHLLEEGTKPGTLVLVNSLLMEREVRRKWQRDMGDFAPDIRTFESWLEELALHSLEADEIPALLPAAEERTLWLEQWLADHDNSGYRRFAGMTSVTAISNIIGGLYRENLRPGTLYHYLIKQNLPEYNASPTSRQTLAELLWSYEQKIAGNNWVDREQLIANVKRINYNIIRHDKLICYLMDDIDPAQERVLQLLVSEQSAQKPIPPEQSSAKQKTPPEQSSPEQKIPPEQSSLEQKIPPEQSSPGQQLQSRPPPELISIHSEDPIDSSDILFLPETPEIPGTPETPETRKNRETRRQDINVNRYPREGGNTDEWREASEQQKESHLAGSSVHMEVFHHPREELEQAVRQILIRMSKQAATFSGHEHTTGGTMSGTRMHGARFEDYVILTGDLALYEDMVNAVSGRFRIPLYTSRGPSLISHPFMRRILTYIKLEHNEFQIDDVFRVFADNRLVLPDLQDHDEQKPPNIRHFSQFCRAYNFRNLKEAAGGMERVFDWLTAQTQYEDDEEREQKRRDDLRRDQRFYGQVIRHLEALRRHYKIPDRRSLKEWVGWTRNLLDLQKDLMSREANEARQLLEFILEKLVSAQQRLGIDRKMSRHDYFNLLELRLKETRERPTEQQGGVLLTEIHQLPEVHDKTVFVLGLHEDGFPKPDRPDFLQFRYEKALRHLTGREGTESYDLARKQLGRLLSSSLPRFLSRPAFLEQKQVMPSPLWLELEDQLQAAPWPGERSKWLISNSDIGQWAAINGKVPQTSAIPDTTKAICRHYLIAMAAEKQRKEPTYMGRYDGVVDDTIMKHWRSQQGIGERMETSISRLDTFATSPQEYFFKYVLRLQPLYEYQDDAESNIKGAVLHHILQDFYSETALEGPPVWPPAEPQAAEKRMKNIRERLVAEYRHQLGNPESPFPNILEKNLERVTRWFLENEKTFHKELAEGLEDLRPAVFYPDFGFTMEHRWSFQKNMGNLIVQFHGMIDRIDLTGDGKNGVIFDYKSGGSGVKRYKNDILRGLSFQLPVYGMYLRERGVQHFLAGYYRLPINGKMKDVKRLFTLGSAELINPESLYTTKGKRRSNKVHIKTEEDMASFMDEIEERRILWILQALRDGRFHVTLTGEPVWSDFRHITRHDERVQLQRINNELTSRNEKGMSFELDRYYLAEPFREDNTNA